MLSLVLAFSLVAPPAGKEAPKVADKPIAASEAAPPVYSGKIEQTPTGLLLNTGNFLHTNYRLVFAEKKDEEAMAKLVGKPVRVVGRVGVAGTREYILVRWWRE